MSKGNDIQDAPLVPGAKSLTQQERIFEAMARVKSAFIPTKNDKEMVLRLGRIVRGIGHEGEPAHGLTVVGETGAGKNTLVLKKLKEFQELQERDDGYGNMLQPMLYFKAPVECTVAGISKEILHRLGFDMRPGGRPDFLMSKVRRSLANNGTKLLVIDEFQHAVQRTSIAEQKKLSDAIKLLIDDIEWPVHIIMIGLPDAERWIEIDETGQMQHRIDLMPIVDLSLDEDGERLEWVIHQLVEERAGLIFSDDQPYALVERLLHAASNRLGIAMKIIYCAIEDALEQGDEAVTKHNWIAAYDRMSNGNNDADDNVFSATHWRKIIRKINHDHSLGPLLAADKAARKPGK